MGDIVTQTRPLNVELATKVWAADNPSGATTFRMTKSGSQETTSYRSGSLARADSDIITPYDLSVFRDSRNVVAKYDTGHEFQTASSRLLTTTKITRPIKVGYSGFDIRLSGDLAVRPDQGGDAQAPPFPAKLTQGELITLGATAISQTRPTAPEAGLANFLGELKRDGLPAYPGALSSDKGPSFQNLGSEYLNIEFGFAPTVADLRKLLRSVILSSQILEQFRRDSGRIVRRRFSFPPTREISKETSWAANRDTYQGLAGSMLVDPGKVEVSDLTERWVWFHGAYSYYLDVGDTLMSKAKRYEELANKLLGTRITPEVLYNLTPWSWLADWWTNIGTALSNVSALQQDGLVIRYGYLMRRTVVTRTVRGNPSTWYTYPETLPISSLYRSERKERWKATPYGFGLNLAGITGRQWAILAALGMTKSPRIAF